MFSRDRKKERIDYIARTVARIQTNDVDLLYKNFLAGIAAIIPARFVSLWLYNQPDDTCVIRAFYPARIGHKDVTFDSFDNRVLVCTDSLTGDVFEAGRPLMFSNVTSSDRFRNPLFAKAHGLEWFISVPILDSKRNPLGVVNVWPLGDASVFDDEAISVASTYVLPITNIIRMANLLIEESLLVAYDTFLEKMLDFTDENVSWDHLALLVRQQMRCDACSIFLANPDDVLCLKGSTGIAGNPPYEHVRYKPPEGLTGKAYYECRPLIFYRELEEENRELHVAKFTEVTDPLRPLKSTLFVPIMSTKDKPIGIVRCINKHEGPARHVGRFNKEDITQLQKISRIV
ncbi:MAG: GAF domain-containing protein, partial [Nitrososphaera sp.]|nr:GAF domain-containing protein [Nitrososphaera sp.]